MSSTTSGTNTHDRSDPLKAPAGRLPNGAPDALKIGAEPKRLLVTSEPYVVLTARGYQAALGVFEQRSKREYFIYIGARSIAMPLEQLRKENGGRMLGLEFWVRKRDEGRFSEYIVEE